MDLFTDCDDAFSLVIITIINPAKFFLYIFSFLCMYIYKTILFIMLPLHQITKQNLNKIINAAVRVFLIQWL